MAGKSTYLRQVALIVLMAQVGSFVPATSARIGVVDRVLTRIGAHDDIAAGRSTFMVEMIEAATILRSATARSLVILDEVGRGTSTFDGMAIAQAIVEDLHDERRRNGAPKTVFATHYHELTALAETLPGLRNYRVDVLERGDDVVFLHAVVKGGADRSYGIHVAGLAGVPEHVTRRARQLLHDLEAQCVPSNESATNEAPCAVCGDLAGLDVLSLSPLQAQSELFRLQQRARSTA
jgi:DNA mismatch repair protein MutS